METEEQREKKEIVVDNVSTTDVEVGKEIPAQARPALIATVLLFVLFCSYILVRESLILQPNVFNDVDEDVVTESQQPTNTPSESSTVFTSNLKNITFRIPVGWKQISSENIFLPFSTSTPWFVIEQESLGCRIASGVHSIGRQVSFADRVYSPRYQFDGSWYIQDTEADRLGIEFDWDTTRRYFQNEVRVSGSIRTDSFFLWEKNGNPVPDACNTALNELLASLDAYYEEMNLVEGMEGSVWIGHLHDDGLDVSIENEKSLLLFTNTVNETYKVFDLPSTYAWYGTFFVKDNKIYGIANNPEEGSGGSEIIVIDPFTKKIEALPGTQVKEHIYSFYLKDDTIYFLTGNTECFKSCQGDLYAVHRTGGIPNLIQKDIVGSILGYDKDTDALWLSEGYGDAGCAYVVMYQYNFLNATQTEYDSASGCDGEFAEDEQVESELDKVFKVYDSAKTKLIPVHESPSILLRSGSLYPGTQKFDIGYGSYAFPQ